MITIGFSTRDINKDFIDLLKKTSGIPKCEIIPFKNNGEYSLTEVYNKILDMSENNIVILLHDDIYFDTKNWGNKILNHFKRNSDYGILGLAGTTNMPKSAKWWEDFSKMKGIVNHEHEGKKWESKYSPSKGNQLDDVVLVDGLFIVVNKKNIKQKFNEEIKGFHFYDVDFSFRNFIEDVKIGVMYDVRVTHKSIGQTNDQWEKNREVFAEKYKDVLPVKVKFDLKKSNNIKVMLADETFDSYDKIVNFLQKNKITVSFLGNVQNDNELKKLKQKNIKYYSVQEPYCYKVGDGKWGFNTPNGPVTSELNKVYKIKEFDYDLIHTTNIQMENYLKSLYPNSNLFIQQKNYESEDELINDYENFLNG